MSSRARLAAAALGATAAAAPTVAAATTYVVRPGDTLGAIALRHGVSVQALVHANGISNPNLIRIGQLLQIPDSSAGLPGYTNHASDVPPRWPGPTGSGSTPGWAAARSSTSRAVWPGSTPCSR